MDIEKIEIKEETIYIKKDILGWHIVNQIKNEDGSFNWFNLIVGSWSNLALIVGLLILIGFFFLAYNEPVKALEHCMQQLPIQVRIFP